MTDILQDLIRVTNTVPSSSRPDAYLSILNNLLSQPQTKLDGATLKQSLSNYLDHTVFSDANATGGNLIVARQILTDFDLAIFNSSKRRSNEKEGDAVMTDSQTEPAIHDANVRRDALEMALEKLQPRVLSFEEQAATIRQHLADLLESTEDWIEAARVLQGIALESSHRSVSDLVKLRTYVRIVRLLLEGDDSVGADTFLKRASLIIHNVPGASSDINIQEESPADALTTVSHDEKVEAKILGLQYKLCQARIYDSQRRFAEAANRFHEVSYVTEIDEAERNMMLSAAVTASILAPAGPLRSRILATLVRDERTASLPQHTILTKVFLDQIIRPAEIASFEKILSPHQRALLPTNDTEIQLQKQIQKRFEDDSLMSAEDHDQESQRMGPSTVLDRAIMEHNIVATSRLYSNITLRGLGALLDVNRSGAENMVRKMIAQNRLKAEIDQVEGLVIFGEQRGLEIGVAGAGHTLEKEGGASVPTDSRNRGNETDVEDDPSTVFTKRWDASIAKTASAVEEICARLRAHELVST